jgi:hypothetical protein
MQTLIRMRVFLLCCLIIIATNVVLIMGGLADSGSAVLETDSLSGCETRYRL